MITSTWQLQTPLDAIIFDCDGTLSTIEGIDELAAKNGKSNEVCALTAFAMGSSGMTPEIYQKRLSLVQPTQQDVMALGDEYIKHCTDDTAQVIAILQRLQKVVYIVSAGLLPAVQIFANYLHVPKQNIYAVDIHFDSNSQYIDYDAESPLAHTTGKQDIVNTIKKQHPSIAFIGDGLNDYAAHQEVTRFIGYGGAFYRKNIADLCQFYVKSISMAPVLALVLTENEASKLNEQENEIYHKGIEAIEDSEVIIK